MSDIKFNVLYISVFLGKQFHFFDLVRVMGMVRGTANSFCRTVCGYADFALVQPLKRTTNAPSFWSLKITGHCCKYEPPNLN